MMVKTLTPAAGAVVATCLLHGDAAALAEVLPTLPVYPADPGRPGWAAVVHREGVAGHEPAPAS
jgi:hypothetical protein